MDADVPRHRPLAFDKMESLIREMQDPVTGVPVRSQKLFLTLIPSAFMGYDLVEWLMDRFNLDESSNAASGGSRLLAGGVGGRPSGGGLRPRTTPGAVEAINLANQLCQYGYFFPVNDSKNLLLKDDSSLYRFQSPYYWPWQPSRVSGAPSAPTLGPDNVEYAIYLVKRTLRNKQRHGLEEYELEALANLKKNLSAKWDFITMQAQEQVRLSKERKKEDKIVSDSQERAYWRVARPPPGSGSALEPCPVPVRARTQRHPTRTIQHLNREIELLKASLDRTRVKASIALEALIAYSETFTPYDPWLTTPQPSNPWVSDDTIFWQINSPIVEVPSEKRVQRWALSMEELVSDPTGLQEFTSFLRKEYSHENIRFWLAVVDLRRSGARQVQKKLDDIYEEFLKPGAACEINIDGATAERVAEARRSGSRFAFDHAADHVYNLLLKKDCYPRFIRSDHFQRLLTEGKNVHQKKAKFFNFGGQVKKKPGSSAAGSGGGGGTLSRRRGSDRSLSGSAHELAVCAAQPPRAPDPPPHSHSQSNLTDIPFRRDPHDDDGDSMPSDTSGSRAGRRRQDSAADSGSSSSDVSSAVPERARRLPQQSTLDGGLRGAPPPLRRLSAVEPRHLAPLASPPTSPRAHRATPPQAPSARPVPRPAPTISVSSAPDDDEALAPPALQDAPSVFSLVDASSVDNPPAEVRKARLQSVASESEMTVEGITEMPLVTESEHEQTCVSAVEVAPEPDSATIVLSANKDDELIDDLPVSIRGEEADEDTISKTSVIQAEIEPSIAAETVKLSVLSATVSTLPTPTATTAVLAASATETLHQPKVEVHTVEAVKKPVPLVSDVCAPATAAVVETRKVVSVAPLAVGEDIGVDDDNIDKVPSAPRQRLSELTEPASRGVTTKIAHEDELSSITKSNLLKCRIKSESSERKQRNDICPWEDENSCESDAPFVKTYATLGYL